MVEDVIAPVVISRYSPAESATLGEQPPLPLSPSSPRVCHGQVTSTSPHRHQLIWQHGFSCFRGATG